MIPCSLERVQCVRGIFRFHHQRQRVSQARNQQKRVASQSSAEEDGGGMLLENVGLSPNYTLL
jgi:hypothetical protein